MIKYNFYLTDGICHNFIFSLNLASDFAADNVCNNLLNKNKEYKCVWQKDN